MTNTLPTWSASGKRDVTYDDMNAIVAAVKSASSGLSSLTVNDSGHLIATLTDGSTVDAGVIPVNTDSVNAYLGGDAAGLLGSVGPYTAITPDMLQHVSGAGAFAGLLGFLRAQTGSAALHIASDSTGWGNTFWPYLLGQWFAQEYPGMGVRYYQWDYDNSVSLPATPGGVNARFSAPVEIQAPANGYTKVTLDGTQYRFLTASSDTYGDLTSADLDVAVKASPAAWPPAAGGVLAARMGAPGEYGWRFLADTNGYLILGWSTDGTNTPSATSTVTVPATANTPLWMRATFKADNGAGGYTVTFYTSTTGADADWTQLGSPVTGSTYTSIYHPAGQDYTLGAYTPNSSGATRWVGNIYEVYLRDGIFGPTVAPTQVQDWTPAAGGLNLYSGGPVLDIIDAAWPSQGINRFTNYDDSYPGLLPLMTPMWPTLAVIFNDSHNDSDQMGPAYLAKWDTWREGIAARLPLARFAVTGQNPRTPPATSIREHAIRHSQLASWAAQNKATFLDVYSAFEDDPRWDGTNTSVLMNADRLGVHPSTLGMAECWLPIVTRAIQTGA